MHQGCPHGLWIVRIKRDIDSAGVFVFEQDFLPCSSAICRTENAAFSAGPVSAAHGSNKNNIRIFGINGNAADVAGSLEADVLPGTAGVSGLINADAISKIGAEVGLASANINNVRV